VCGNGRCCGPEVVSGCDITSVVVVEVTPVVTLDYEVAGTVFSLF
jgi:hypothetical protein